MFQLHLSKLTHEGGENELLKDSKRERELTSMILDMDAKHGKCCLPRLVCMTQLA